MSSLLALKGPQLAHLSRTGAWPYPDSSVQGVPGGTTQSQFQRPALTGPNTAVIGPSPELP